MALTSKELVANAVAYLQKSTCYLKGFWCQWLTKSEYDRVNAQYKGANDKYCNTGLIGTNVYAGDCICWIKQLLAGGNVNRRLSYTVMASNPLGDCTNKQFYDKLYDLRSPAGAPAGYGLATEGHAALCIGGDQWLDFNYTGSQNGIRLHTGFSGTNFRCGKIPGVVYEEPAPTPAVNEKEVIDRFLAFLRDSYLNR